MSKKNGNKKGNKHNQQIPTEKIVLATLILSLIDKLVDIIQKLIHIWLD